MGIILKMLPNMKAFQTVENTNSKMRLKHRESERVLYLSAVSRAEFFSLHTWRIGLVS